jgi:hypothetical protein
MPKFAHLSTNLNCPNCNTLIRNILWFQWGLCSSEEPRKDSLYQINDPIRWRVCDDGQIQAWTYFQDPNEGNLGDPEFRNLIIRDTSHFFDREVVCLACHKPIGGAIIEITDGIIRKARIYLPSEFDPNIDIYTLETGGTLTPRAEWNDHPMALINNC